MKTAQKPLLAKESGTLNLEERIARNLEKRLLEQDDFCSDEINTITKLDHRLFPVGFELDAETTRNMRALAKLSQLELKPAREITSHRKFLGPIIVTLKKLSWPLISVHLKDSFSTLQELSSWTLRTLTKHTVELEELKKE